MNPSSGQPNFGQNFNQAQNPNVSRNPNSVNSGEMGNLATNMNQNFANPNAAPENAPMGNVEQLANHEIAGNQMVQSAPVQQPVIVPVQPDAQPAVATPAAQTATAAAPITATDSDKIEQEWVDTAKKVISATKADPHAQNAAVADLMRDYIRKRYGKEVGKEPED